MSSGFEWDETLPWSDPKNDEPHLAGEADPIRYILSKPIVKPPDTEWTYLEQDLDKWPLVIAQDISNMVEMQRGYKSRGFRGNLPNPWQERKVTNLHEQLAKYMGTGAPMPLVD